MFFDGFGDNPDGMYFALHITGKSETGIFTQKANNAANEYIEAYARDLEMQFFNLGIAKLLLSQLYKQYGLQDIYSLDYGWTDKDGVKLDMRFYLGTKYFYTNNNYFNFENFVIMDTTQQGGFGGEGFETYPDFVRCNDDLKFNIPLDTYNPAIHKNIALLTVEFRDAQCNDYTVTFDGFVEK